MSETSIDSAPTPARQSPDTTPLPTRSGEAIIGMAIRLFVTNLPLLLAIVLVPHLLVFAVLEIGHLVGHTSVGAWAVLLEIPYRVVVFGALIAASMQIHLTYQKGFHNSIFLMWPTFRPLFCLSLLCLAVVPGGIFLAAASAVFRDAPGIFGFGLFLVFVVTALLGPLLTIAGFGIVVERLGVFAALRQARSLCAGRYGDVVAGFTLLLLFGLVIFGGLWVIALFVPGGDAVGWTLFSSPLPMVPAILGMGGFYIDIRGRKEGLTVGALRRQIDLFDPAVRRNRR